MYIRVCEWEDAVDLYELLKEPEISRWLSMPLDDLDGFLRYFETAILIDHEINWVIENQDERIIGFLHLHSMRDDCCEIGYYLHPQYHHRSIMYKAVQKLLNQAPACVLAYIAQDNTASMKLVKKLGFEYLAQREPMYLNDFKMHEMALYGYERRKTYETECKI